MIEAETVVKSARTYDQFVENARSAQGEPESLYRQIRGHEFPITAWEWLAAVLPTRTDRSRQGRAWARCVVYYNAWAGSLGRHTAEISDIHLTGTENFVELCQAITALPEARAVPPHTRIRAWSTHELEYRVAASRAKSTADHWMNANGIEARSAPAVRGPRAETETALVNELHRRGFALWPEVNS